MYDVLKTWIPFDSNEVGIGKWIPSCSTSNGIIVLVYAIDATVYALVSGVLNNQIVKFSRITTEVLERSEYFSLNKHQ